MNKQTPSPSLDHAVMIKEGASVSGGMGMKSADVKPAKRPRDLRLDFFRGIAMFIILIAHIPWNSWTLWIPARFGFSDATEIFVFCSGMASALAFAAVFDHHGWFMGAARVAHRIWQVYWAHISLFLAICVWVSFIDVIGQHGNYNKEDLNLMHFFRRDTAQQLLGLFSLTYVPNYFDILPMYMVILMMIPLVMALSRLSPYAALGFCVLLWAGTNFEGWYNWFYGENSSVFRLSAQPWNSATWMEWYNRAPLSAEAIASLQPINWFFNPFGWQLIFFTGFAFMRGWLPKPPVNRTLIFLALAVLVLSFPLAYFRIIEGKFWSDAVNQWVLSLPFTEWRSKIDWLITKSDFGLFRYLHFLAVGYLAWVAVGEGGRRLVSDGLWGRIVTVIRTVGQQSLAIFLFSMLFARMLGYTFIPPVGHPFHITGEFDTFRWLHTLIINLIGIGAVIFVAYLVTWFKKQPWRNPPRLKAV